MHSIDRMIADLSYESFPLVGKVFYHVYEMAADAYRHKNKHVLVRLLDKLFEWRTTINNYCANREAASTVASLNMRRTVKELDRMSAILNEMLLDKYRF